MSTSPLQLVDQSNGLTRPFGPTWWVQALAKKQNARRAKLQKYLDYYNDDHDLSFASPKFREAFGWLFKEFAVNVCGVVVSAPVERMKVQGISVPTNDPDDDSKPQRAFDEQAWEMWQRNDLDAGSQIHHTQLLTTGYGYATVWGDDDDRPVITIEDPLQMIVAHTSGTPRKPAAALKRWVDEWTGFEFATLYLPDGIYKFKSRVQMADVPASDITTDWVVRSDKEWFMENPLERVPVVEFANEPTVRGEGRSEIRSVIPIQDAINKEICDMLVASEYGAYRQRYAIGLEPKIDERTGKEVAPFQAAFDRVWATPNEGAKFGEFSATDLGNYVEAFEALLQATVFITKTPRHYLIQSGQSPSGDALKSAETGLVAKVKNREVPIGEAWEQVIRLGYLVVGDKKKAEAWDAEVKWGDPEYRTEGELTDAVIKQHQSGLIPWEFAVDKLGYSPQDIEKMRKMRMRDSLMAEATNLSSLLEDKPEPAPTA